MDGLILLKRGDVFVSFYQYGNAWYGKSEQQLAVCVNVRGNEMTYLTFGDFLTRDKAYIWDKSSLNLGLFGTPLRTVVTGTYKNSIVKISVDQLHDEARKAYDTIIKELFETNII